MDRKMKLAQAIAKLMDNQFRVLGFRFGLDPIIGLIPGLGEVLPVLFSAYLVILGKEMGLPEKEIYRMVSNIILDVIIGAVPVIGDIGDFVFKSNQMNLEILKKHYYRNQQPAEEGEIVS